MNIERIIMKRILWSGLLIAVFPCLMTGGCGGGGGEAPPNTVTMTLSSSGDLASGTQIGAIDVTLTIPSGVTMKDSSTKAESPVTATYPNVVKPSGVAANDKAITLATYTAPQTLNIMIANPDGFGIGEFATLTLNITTGSSVTESDFAITSLSAADLNGAAISGLTGSFTVSSQ